MSSPAVYGREEVVSVDKSWLWGGLGGGCGREGGKQVESKRGLVEESALREREIARTDPLGVCTLLGFPVFFFFSFLFLPESGCPRQAKTGDRGENTRARSLSLCTLAKKKVGGRRGSL